MSLPVKHSTPNHKSSLVLVFYEYTTMSNSSCNFTPDGMLSEDVNSQWLLDQEPIICRICDQICPNSVSLLHHFETHQVEDVTLSILRNDSLEPIDQSQPNRCRNPNQPALIPQISQNQMHHFALRENYVPNVLCEQTGFRRAFQTITRDLDSTFILWSAFVPLLNEPLTGNTSYMSSISHLPNDGLGSEMTIYSPSNMEDLEENCIDQTRHLVKQLEKPIGDIIIIDNEEDEAGTLDLNLKL